MIIRRHPLTLIELLIVITIMVLVGGLASINVRGMLRQQGFYTEVGAVVDQLRLAQDLMLLMPGDFQVRFIRQGDGYLMEVDTDAVLTEGWAKELKRQRRFLKEIHYIKFEDATSFPISEPGVIAVKFLSGGGLMSRGVIALSADRRGGGELSSEICLYGYPHPIEVAAGKSCRDRKAEHYDERLTVYTVQEINEIDREVSTQQTE